MTHSWAISRIASIFSVVLAYVVALKLRLHGSVCVISLILVSGGRNTTQISVLILAMILLESIFSFPWFGKWLISIFLTFYLGRWEHVHNQMFLTFMVVMFHQVTRSLAFGIELTETLGVFKLRINYIQVFVLLANLFRRWLIFNFKWLRMNIFTLIIVRQLLLVQLNDLVFLVVRLIVFFNDLPEVVVITRLMPMFLGWTFACSFIWYLFRVSVLAFNGYATAGNVWFFNSTCVVSWMRVNYSGVIWIGRVSVFVCIQRRCLWTSHLVVVVCVSLSVCFLHNVARPVCNFVYNLGHLWLVIRFRILLSFFRDFVAIPPLYLGQFVDLVSTRSIRLFVECLRLSWLRIHFNYNWIWNLITVI